VALDATADMRGSRSRIRPRLYQQKRIDDTRGRDSAKRARALHASVKIDTALPRRCAIFEQLKGGLVAKGRVKPALWPSTPKPHLRCDAGRTGLVFSRLALPENRADTGDLKGQKPATRPLDPFQGSRRPAWGGPGRSPARLPIREVAWMKLKAAA